MKTKRLQRWWQASCKRLLWGLIPLLALSGNLQAQECVTMSTTSGNTSPTLIRNEQTIANGVETIALAPDPLEALAITGELTFTERDGYYRWGLGGRPEGLDAPLLQDADDTDPNIGPMDSLGHAK